jgi:serine-type D-Ala-D-Ala carboxypeptidase (penicillin-binding protein 5/6)
MTPKVDELLRGMIVQSGNDASVALAEGVGGTLENLRRA